MKSRIVLSVHQWRMVSTPTSRLKTAILGILLAVFVVAILTSALIIGSLAAIVVGIIFILVVGLAIVWIAVLGPPRTNDTK